MSTSKVFTNATGSPVADNTNIMTAGPRGPALLQDIWLMEKLATQAVLLRSKGLADYYGANGVTFHTDILGGNGGSAAAPAATGDSFNWTPVLAATLAGMLLLAAAATALTRRKHRLSY